MNGKRAREFRKAVEVLTKRRISDPLCRKVYRKAKKDYIRNVKY